MSRFVVAMVAAFSLGCVSTKVHYQAVPDLPRDGFHTVLVLAAYADLEYRQEVETAALEGLRSNGITARSGSEFMMRTEGQRPDEQLAALVAEGVDVVLLMEPRGAGSSNLWIPTPITTTATTTTIGNTTTTTAHTYGGGGIPSTRSWSDAHVTLFDPAARRRVWEATLKGDDQGWGYEMAHVLRKMAEKAVVAFVEQRVLQPPK